MNILIFIFILSAFYLQCHAKHETVDELIDELFSICGVDLMTTEILSDCIDSNDTFERHHFISRFLGGLEPDVLVSLVDRNGDGFIDNKEFSNVANKKDDTRDNFEVIDRHGNKHKMSRQTILNNIEKQREGMVIDDNILSKSNEGLSSLSDLKKDKPELAYYISLAQWSGDKLRKSGYRFGDLLHMKSGSKKDGRIQAKKIQSNNNFAIWFQLEFEIDMTENRNKQNSVWVEVLLIRDSQQEVEPPHLKIRGAWELNETGQRENKLL